MIAAITTSTPAYHREDGDSQGEQAHERRVTEWSAETHCALVDLSAPVAGDCDEPAEEDRRDRDQEVGATEPEVEHLGGDEPAAD